MSAKHDPDSDAKGQPAVAYFGSIFIASIMVLVGVWIYFLVGGKAVDVFTKAVITLAIIAVMVFIWRLHRWRQRKALELLQRWAEKDETPPTRPRRN
jgi:amino acid permease